MHVCFPEVRRCSTSASTWRTAREAFLSSIMKTNQEKGLGLNLDQCKLGEKEEEEKEKLDR